MPEITRQALFEAYHADKDGPGQGLTPLEDRVDQWIAEKEKRRGDNEMSIATVDQYAYALRKVFLPWAASEFFIEATQVDDKAMERLKDNLQKRTRRKADGKIVPLSVETRRSYLRAVRTFLNWASVPVGKFTYPKKPQRIVETLTREEIDRIEGAANEERDRLIVRVLADTGVRVSELLNLRRADLFENTHDRRYWIRVIGKGDKQRDVPIPAPVYRNLKHFAERSREEYIFMGKRRRASGTIERLTPSGVGQLIHDLAREAGITKRVYPHIFRHSFITHLLVRGVGVVHIQKLVGHTTLAMISQNYGHLVGQDMYETVTKALG
jgi:integrase/recombinase XerD